MLYFIYISIYIYIYIYIYTFKSDLFYKNIEKMYIKIMGPVKDA